MARFSLAQIEEVKSRIDLADLIAGYGIQIRRSGSSLKCCCPFHHEKTPSFVIHPAKGFYHCFGCGASGDAFKFVMQQEGLTFAEAVRKLADQVGVKLEEREDPGAEQRARLYAILSEAAAFYHRCLLKTKEAQPARDYLASRDLGPDVQEKYLLGYAPRGMKVMATWAKKYGYSLAELAAAGLIKAPESAGDEGYHRFGGRVMFSVNDRQGRVVAFSGRQLVREKNSGKYVNSPETEVFKKSRVLFGFDKAAGFIAKDPHREVIICEGQIDCIRLHISGFPNAVASQGTAFTAEHAQMLKRVADTAILCFDDDGAGHKATIRTAALMLAADIPVRVLLLPDGDDPDSFLRTKGPEAFRQLLETRTESIVSAQVRIARAQEQNPAAIDAVSRVARAVLATLAQCSSPIVKASLAGEAARLLGLPLTAINEELGKLKTSAQEAAQRTGETPASPEEEQIIESEADLPPVPGMDAAAALPPSRLELELMSFLLAHEEDREVQEVVRAYLPPAVLPSPFTQRFVASWLMQRGNGWDPMRDFTQSLTKTEFDWFSRIDRETDVNGEGDASTVLEEKVRNLWIMHLKELKFNLPKTVDPKRILELTMAAQQLKSVRWSKVRDFIKGFQEEKYAES